jgi:hypothetical protein
MLLPSKGVAVCALLSESEVMPVIQFTFHIFGYSVSIRVMRLKGKRKSRPRQR